ncbi:zinc finger, SWIM domain-containing protein [Bifidobacterium sp. DSM 109958]|uniref:Zinc finger, SWIM domain-containing protein n=1 Tax=Bifidobacterium moraviense TaxID=2675323 RepID=A0A7Y0HYT0_9BIFI|nr:SWIM zinc finger family protein [Bifidobacterium sp. DSM 109958]NMM99662.1 zinc finger, SWIM domain-containing protein [Bifidobacterium sp. DSM 109958]
MNGGNEDINEIPRLNDHYVDLFEQRILDRGSAYFAAGKVHAPRMIAPGLWHAAVFGSAESVYEVDVRLRYGTVVSAACTCPYAQRSAFCKHMAAVLLAMDDMRRRSDRARRNDDSDSMPVDDGFPWDASMAVRWYVRAQFPQVPKLTDDDWEAVKRIFEALFCLPDLDKTFMSEEMRLLYERTFFRGQDDDQAGGQADRKDRSAPDDARERRRLYAQMQNDYEPRHETLTQQHESRYRAGARGAMGRTGHGSASLDNMRLLVPFVTPCHLDELPHTWMTILEAAYEHLHDAVGLRRLYVYYIAIAQTDPEAVYVQKLRDLSGEHWQEDRDAIVAFMQRHRFGGRGEAPTNPAYERLLREDGLSDEAWDYCRIKSRDILIRMLDVVALKESNAVRALRYVESVLGDPDSPVFEQNTESGAQRVARWIRKVDLVYGYEQAKTLAEQACDMFPRRQLLREALADYLDAEQADDDADVGADVAADATDAAGVTDAEDATDEGEEEANEQGM